MTISDFIVREHFAPKDLSNRKAQWTAWIFETKSYIWSTEENNALLMFHFRTPQKNKVETVKIGLYINFKEINRLKSDLGKVEMDAMRKLTC